ncbi:MAG: hypothetical protein WKG07_21100 [Hymenobacter sp.]
MFAVPSIVYIAHLKNLLDTPNGRTVHAVANAAPGGSDFRGLHVGAYHLRPAQQRGERATGRLYYSLFCGVEGRPSDHLSGQKIRGPTAGHWRRC